MKENMLIIMCNIRREHHEEVNSLLATRTIKGLCGVVHIFFPPDNLPTKPSMCRRLLIKFRLLVGAGAIVIIN